MNFCDSFDHYTRPQVLRKWSSDPIPMVSSVVTGRTGNGLYVGSVYTPSYLIAEVMGECTVGIAYKTTSYKNPPIIMYSQEREMSCTLDHVGDGRLYVKTSIGQSGPTNFVINRDQWYYIELHIQVGSDVESMSTTVVYEVYINQLLVLNGIMIGNYVEKANVAEITLRGPGGGFSCIFDDLYISQLPLGDVSILTLRPKSNATTNNWIPSDPLKQNWELVKDTTPDDDLTFIYSRPFGDQYDLYYIDEINAPDSGRVQGVQICVSPKGMDKSPPHLGTFFKSTVGGDFIYNIPDYYYFLDVREGVSIMELTLPIGVKAWD